MLDWRSINRTNIRLAVFITGRRASLPPLAWNPKAAGSNPAGPAIFSSAAAGGYLPAAQAALPEPHAILRPHRARVPVGARAGSQATPIEARRHLRGSGGARNAQSDHAVPAGDDPRPQRRSLVFPIRAGAGEESADRLPGGERR